MSTDNHVCKAVRQKSAQMFTISPKIRYREQMEKNSHALGFNGSSSSRKCDIQVNFAGGSIYGGIVEKFDIISLSGERITRLICTLIFLESCLKFF